MTENPAESVDYGCEICGRHCDDCICPECPVCHAQGDPGCYVHHGLVLPPTERKRIIRNQSEMIHLLNASTVEEATRRLYNDVGCGPWIVFEATGVRIGSIVEGCDGDGAASHTLEYPFTEAAFDAAIEEIEADVERISAEIEADGVVDDDDA